MPKIVVQTAIASALSWVGACQSQPSQMAAPIAPTVPPLRKPIATLFGVVEDHEFVRQSNIELSEGTGFGWRIKLPCVEPMLFRETLQLPKPGGWPDRVGTQVSEDRTRAVVEEYSGCYDGWIQHTWFIAEGDPPGEYVLTVEVAGYQPQTFRGTFTE